MFNHFFVPVFDGMLHGTNVTSLSGNVTSVIGMSTSSCEDVVTSHSSTANTQLADSAAVESLSDVFRCFICMERLRLDFWHRHLENNILTAKYFKQCDQIR
jgi:hypothetical protein